MSATRLNSFRPGNIKDDDHRRVQHHRLSDIPFSCLWVKEAVPESERPRNCPIPDHSWILAYSVRVFQSGCATNCEMCAPTPSSVQWDQVAALSGLLTQRGHAQEYPSDALTRHTVADGKLTRALVLGTGGDLGPVPRFDATGMSWGQGSGTRRKADGIMRGEMRQPLGHAAVM